MTMYKSDIMRLFHDYMRYPNFAGVNLCDVDQRGNFGDCPIHLAASRGSIDELIMLIQNHANINTPGEHQFTALHTAVLRGHFDCVKLLIQSGADLSAKNDDGHTPLSFANICKEIDNIGERQKILQYLQEIVAVQKASSSEK